jgi:hypothetical protein
MTPARYQHAIDAGVYLRGVDSSHPAVKIPIDASKVGHAAVLLIIGQSNGGNHGETRHSARGHVYNFNPFDGLCYAASDPLLGATGDDGSPWCLAGDTLIEIGFARAVLLAPLCVGGATVADWAPGGPYHHRMTYCLQRLGQARFWPSHVLWHQGEANALYGTSATDYIASFRALAASLRGLGVAAPIFVATASYFAIPAGFEQHQETTRRAQAALIDAAAGIFRGPDTDIIRDRFDGCHMGKAGLEDHAKAWVGILQDHRRARGR